MHIEEQDSLNLPLSIICGNELSRFQDQPKTLSEALFATVQSSIINKGITYLHPDGVEVFQTYADLWKDALRLVRAFRCLNLSPKSALILQLEENQQFITSFWGGVLAGAIVVPLAVSSSYEQENSAARKLEDAWKFLDHPPVITSRERLPELIRWAKNKGLEHFQAFAIEDLLQSDSADSWHQALPDDLSLLFFTSGSTGAQKAVMLSHENLLSMVMGMVQMHELSHQDVTFNWMPFDHVAAIGMMHLPAVLLGYPQVNVSTQTILLDPLQWLEGMHRYRATVSWAPNFAFAMIADFAEEINTRSWDLSSVRYLFNGGEAVIAKVGHRFLELLAPKGLSQQALCPAWGMSETSSGVIYSHRFSLTNEKDLFVEVGYPIPGFSVRIVDDHNRLVPEGSIGRLQVTGPSVTKGYYKQPELNKSAFTSDGWFDTGDCGFLSRGSLTITGRTNDAIIINGVNYYGHLIEAAVEELPEIVSSYTAACAVREAGDFTDQLAIFFVTSLKDESEQSQLLKKISYYVVQSVGASPKYLIPVAMDKIPKTTIGKIQRSQLKRAFENGEFAEQLQKIGRKGNSKKTGVSPSSLTEQIIDLFIEELNVNGEIDPDTNIHSLGINSILMIKLIREIEKRYRIKIQTRELLKYSTVQLLAAYISEKSALKKHEEVVYRKNGGENQSLSEVQKGLWAIQKISPQLTAYHLPLCFRVSSQLDIQKLEKAFHLVLEQFPILTSRIEESNGAPLLKQHAVRKLPFFVEDISQVPESEIFSLIRQKVKAKFDLENECLIRFHLLSRSENEHFLLVVIHHIIFDGISSLIFLQTLLEAYRCLMHGEKFHVAIPSATFSDFVAWEQQMLSSQSSEEHASYWKQQLSGVSSNFLLDSGSDPIKSETISMTFDHLFTERMRNFAKDRAKNVSTVLLSAYFILLHRYSGSEDIVIGMPVAVRPEEQFDRLIGLFLNLIPIREKIHGDLTFLEFIDQLQLTLYDGLDHAAYPFSKINLPRGQLGSSFLQAAFFYQNFFHTTSYKKILQQYKETASLEFIKEIQQEGEFPLVFEIWDDDDEITLNIKCNTEGLSAVIENMAQNYIQLVKALIEFPNRAIKEYSVIAENEKKALLYSWNDTEAEYPNLCFYALFQQHVQKTPNAIAVISEEGSLTYSELDKRSNSLASYLQHLGVGPEALVGICVDRSLQMIVGLLAILKAGGAYVPLDPKYPPKHLEYILNDCQASLILTQSRFQNLFAQYDKQLIFLDILRLAQNCEFGPTRKLSRFNCFSEGSIDLIQPSEKQLNPEALARSKFTILGESEYNAWDWKFPLRDLTSDTQRLAYVIYTSGSTGQPKGVMIEHRSLTNFLLSMAGKLKVSPKDRLLALTTYNFDIAGLELFLPLIVGAQCHIAQSEKNPDQLKGLIRKVRPTLIQATPATWTMLFQSGWKNEEGVRILCGGEALSSKLKENFLQTASEAWNLFGPTETTIWSTVQQIQKDSPITIGKPIANTQIYILDKYLEPLPIGTAGELFIAGNGLARGYWNQPGLTAEKFIDNPFALGTKLYKTGDLARWLPNGQIEYLGRADTQVKIRGFRIELGAIEHHVSAHPGVSDNATIVKQEGDHKKLVSYYVVNQSGASLSAEELRTFLRSRLPDYMIPAHFIKLNNLPLTPNGKVDRKDLAKREIASQAAAESEVEGRILSIWRDVLNVKDIGVHDGFFDVGGDSLLAVSIVERIKQAFSCEIGVTELFAHPNIHAMSQYLVQQKQNQSLKTSQELPDYFQDSVAIIGISCQFPGAKDHLAFWNNLKEGKESVKFFTKSELVDLGVSEDLIENPHYIPAEASIDGKDLFDPEFFQLSIKDAEMMDPQLRLLLLHSWKAIEDAGYSPKKIPDTSVYMSASNNSYRSLLSHEEILENSDSYVSWVLSQSGTIPTLISHKLGLKGPSFFVHSNCSSSLVGLYNAYLSLKSGESSYALVGATTLHAHSSIGYVYQSGLNFSSDGHIKPFDAAADGMIGGEGVAVILLKKAVDAMRDGDHIYSILRGIAVNNDGAEKVGFYAPSVQGQSSVIDQVLSRTGINPESISYIEAHGTGTKIGDPIEVAALRDAFKKYTDKKQFCGIGSVKSNIGHLDTAAGLAGCIKVILSLSNNELVPTINYKTPNPELKLENSPFYIVEKNESLKAVGPARAALSSFGIGGTNVHAIFEQYRPPAKLQIVKPPYYIPLSAKNEERLLAYIQELLSFLQTQSDDRYLENIAYTLQYGREPMASRALFIVQTIAELKGKLENYIRGERDALAKNIDWEQLYPHGKPDRISLPTYPFAQMKIWPNSEPTLQEDNKKEDFVESLKSIIAKVVKIEEARILLDLEWNVYGFDSISFVQLANEINRTFQLEINPSIFFELKTLRSFCDQIIPKSAEVIKKQRSINKPRPINHFIPSAVKNYEFEPIAIIGMSGKFPRAADLDEFWNNLLDEKDCITEIPSDRWDWREYDGDPIQEENKTNVNKGGFIDSVAEFDPLFFGISPREAPFIDPQHRLLLTYAWKAIEDAGYSAKSLAGTNTGVFVGTGNTGYRDLFVQANLPIDAYSATGHMIPSLGPNRLSYFLDIHGPSEPIETSCSSSLVAIHRAISAIHDGSCAMAITGGVNTIVNPDGYISYSKAGMLSLDGKCRAFGKDASGYVRGEGVGIILLKKLQDAERDKDQIHGIIRTSFENHGGRANTLTSPNPKAQTNVIVAAYKKGEIDPSAISYIEAHGTGTHLGDPIEINGLKAAFKELCPESTEIKHSCGIGSVKTNIGHLEVAAGISGVIKVLLQMKHKTLVKSLHSETLNPYIELKNSPFYIVQQTQTWAALKDSNGKELPRMAGVSSFGIGGVNAHLVIEEYLSNENSSVGINPSIILLSAKTEEGLKTQAEQLLLALQKNNYTDRDLIRIAYTLQVGRDAMEERLAIIVSNLEELEEKLRDFVEGKNGIKNLYQGSSNKDVLAEIIGDEDMEIALQSWITKRKYPKLLSLWVKGHQINWDKFYSNDKPRRISLPTYPFAKESYWLPQKQRSEARKTERPTYFLQKDWNLTPSNPKRKEVGIVLILANSSTMHLAKALSSYFPHHSILNAEQMKFSPSAYDWKEIDGFIDLIGCGKQEDLSIEWMQWLQHLIEHGHKNGLILLCVTKGLEPYQNLSINLSGAPRAGLYRMLQSEYNHLKSRHLDVDFLEDGVLAKQIADEFFGEGDDPEVCIRNGFRYRSFLKPKRQLDKESPKSRSFPEGHVLLITGGTRGIGFLCAKHFVKHYGVKKLVLIGREQLPPREQWGKISNESVGKKIKAIQELEAQGVQIQPLALCLSDAEAVQKTIQGIKETMGPIGGVIHCAGIVDMATLAFIRKTPEKLYPVIEPKIFGTINLYQLLHKEPLKFFVLFSSVSAIIPYLSAGQGDYTMANAFLDYFAEAHKKDCPLVSIQWPNWKEAGMGEVTNRAYLESGILSITDAEGLKFLDQILANPVHSVILPAVVDPLLWKPEQLMMNIKPEKVEKNKLPQTVKKIEEAPQDLPQDTTKWLIALFSEELKINPEQFKIDKPFQDYGVDSIILVQLLHKINQKLSANLDPSILYEYTTIQSFSQWLTKSFGPIKESHKDIPLEAEYTVPSQEKFTAVSVNEIAVVGMSCRFAGAETLEGYWELLSQGRSGIRPIPANRWPSSSYGGMLNSGTESFDHQFFHIPKEDAKEMDPQALLVLEECLNLWYQAGYSHHEIKGKNIGVYIGGRSQHTPDTAHLLCMKNPILAVGQNYLAANVSQFFDLRGPSLVLDTACSSALVCMNMAIQALRNNEIEAAIVGGVGYLATDAAHHLFEQRGILSKGPQFHLFDKRAQGIILGEGVGVVLLKTLEKALRDGDRIEAVIKGIAINNDGRTAGPATPSFEAQKLVMQEALARSGKKPEEIGYIEANGSGSIVTDLLELKAIQGVYCLPGIQRSLKLGSIKPNIGHPLCAEGIASFIKVVLMLKHRQFVPFLSGQQGLEHFDRKAAHIEFSPKLEVWDGPLPVAAINCFADGGTNAHLIVEAVDSVSSKKAPLLPPQYNKPDFSNIWEGCEIET